MLMMLPPLRPLLRRWPALLAIVWVPLISAATLAQEVADENKIEPAADEGQWIAVLVAMVLTMCVMAISFLSPRRSHQD